MLATERTSPRTLHRHQAVRATMTLARLVRDPRGWEPGRAARQLRLELDDDRLLRVLRVHVVDAMQDRATPVDHRALVTLDRALLEVPVHD
jgi:hypothetical protein